MADSLDVGVVQTLVTHALSQSPTVICDNADADDILQVALASAIEAACTSEDINAAPAVMTIPAAFAMGVRMAAMVISNPVAAHHVAAAREIDSFHAFVVEQARGERADRRLLATTEAVA